MTAKERGDRGEQMALDCLLAKGYRLLGRNLRFGKKELDLVLLDGETVVFAEVKARSSASFGTPAAFVGARKQSNLVTAAQCYLIANNLTDAFCRFDVLEVYLREGRVVHIADAFSA